MLEPISVVGFNSCCERGEGRGGGGCSGGSWLLFI